MKPTIMTAVCFFLLGGCSIPQDKTQYIRSGLLKDRFDHRAYQYIEAGKTVPITEWFSINGYFGFHSEGSEQFDNPEDRWRDYWEVNCEFRW